MRTPAPVEYHDIERALLLENHRTRLMPRFTPMNWWECDVCEITANGYFREYEIKVSKSDFRIDGEKERRHWDRSSGFPGTITVENKHALLAGGDPRGPSAFYFVTPIGLLSPTDIPVWAGWIEVVRTAGGLPVVKTRKRAPRLHRQKADPSIVNRMLSSAYGRLHVIWKHQYDTITSSRNFHELREANWEEESA